MDFHRKYRSTTFATYIGNTKMKAKAMQALRNDSKRPQVILLEGSAGCGKTTMARLIAKEVRCEHRNDLTGACGVCESCKEMDRFIQGGDQDEVLDLKELDIGDTNKKEDIDQIMELARQPIFSGWRIFILDEVHNLSKPAQTMLLKTLEEPPEHVLFILCTTNPEGLLDTILSRCQYRFKVTKPTRLELCELLARVCVNEKIDYEDKGLSLIAAKSDFVPRQALVLLEQVFTEKGSCKYTDAVASLSAISDEYYFKFFDLLTKHRDVYKYINFIAGMKSSLDLKQFVEGLIAFTLKGIYTVNGVVDLELDKSEIKEFQRVFKSFSVSETASVLHALMCIKRSSSIETQLILLGYTGFESTVGGKGSEAKVEIDLNASDAGKESKISSNSYQEMVTLNEEDKEKIVSDNTQDMTLEDLSAMLGDVEVINESKE